MRRAFGYTLVLGVGLVPGFSLRAGLEPAREDRMATMLEEVCLPFVTGQDMDPGARFEQVGVVKDRMYVDRASAGLVQVSAPSGRRACSVSDTLDPLKGAARERFIAAGAEFAARHLPEMPLRDLTDDVGWALFHHYGIKDAYAPGVMNLMIIDFGAADSAPGVRIEVVRFLADEAEA